MRHLVERALQDNGSNKGDPDAQRFAELLVKSMAIEEHTALMEAALARNLKEAMALIDHHVRLTPWQQRPAAAK